MQLISMSHHSTSNKSWVFFFSRSKKEQATAKCHDIQYMYIVHFRGRVLSNNHLQNVAKKLRKLLSHL